VRLPAGLEPAEGLPGLPPATGWVVVTSKKPLDVKLLELARVPAK
jgi:hypothetical protein